MIQWHKTYRINWKAKWIRTFKAKQNHFERIFESKDSDLVTKILDSK